MEKAEIRWRPPAVLLIPTVSCCIFFFYVNFFQLTTFKITSTFMLQSRFVEYVDNSSLTDFLMKTEGCQIPYMNPFDPSVVQFITKEKSVVCNNNKPPLINSNLTFLYLLETSLPAYKIIDISVLKCCYSVFKRVIPSLTENDNKIAYAKCITFNKTAEIKDEYVRVTCSYNNTQIYKDFFAFVPLNVNFEIKNLTSNNSYLNVLIIGLDSVSRVNLHRQMPKTMKVLKETGAIEFLGYTKVGDNTFPNLVPILTGLNQKEFTQHCWQKRDKKFDNCPFVWKNFSQNNYATAFGEDSSWMGMFNYAKKGFRIQPTDYYWNTYNYVAEKEIGNERRKSVPHCIGSRKVHEVFLKYIMDFAKSMRQYTRPYFGIFWESNISHDFLNTPKLGDDSYATFFRNMSTAGFLNDTILLFISDHGMRWGGIRSTYQGRMEERLPFLFIMLPNDYSEVYYTALTNIKRNTRRLTTPFDLHETIKDLLKPHSLTQDFINRRIQTRRGNERAYSLFETIPTTRTCSDAGIAAHWCTCQRGTDIDKNSSVVFDTVKFAVDYINEKLKGHMECAKLSLAEIYNAREYSSNAELFGGKTYSLDYTVVFTTVPGGGIFEATVRKHVNKQNKKYHFSIAGTISRINLYGTQSTCMTEYHLKLYCYCK